MGKEIERKFLVDKEGWNAANKPNPKIIKQGYITNEEDKTVRVRIIGEKGKLTIKGKTDGFERAEFEYEIPFEDAEQLLEDFCEKYIHKKRYEIEFEEKTWEVDEFIYPNPGLLLAEIELETYTEEFTKPKWIRKEVSDDPDYYNSNMLK